MCFKWTKNTLFKWIELKQSHEKVNQLQIKYLEKSKAITNIVHFLRKRNFERYKNT